MSETPCNSCTQNSLSTLYILSIYSSYTLSRMQPTYNKFLNALFVQDTASLEPSEVEVRSISLIISKTHFFHCFLFLLGILFLFHSFSKKVLQKLSLPFFNNLENQNTFSCFFLNLKAQYLNHPIQLHYKSLRSKIKSFYMLLITLHLMP